MVFRIGQNNNRTNKDNIGFSIENNRKYDTIQPMKYSVQYKEIQPYPSMCETQVRLFNSFFQFNRLFPRFDPIIKVENEAL